LPADQPMDDSALAEAMMLHRAGRFDQAAAFYRAILDNDQDDVDGLHLLGLVTYRRAGKP
jgi:protein O-GlcNAc transferase